MDKILYMAFWGVGYADEGEELTVGGQQIATVQPEFFSEENGYSAIEVRSVAALALGEAVTLTADDRVHSVVRIK